MIGRDGKEFDNTHNFKILPVSFVEWLTLWAFDSRILGPIHSYHHRGAFGRVLLLYVGSWSSKSGRGLTKT